MNTPGRPTDYKPEYCELAYGYTLLGATQEEVAGLLGVTRRTIGNWADSHPEFARALEQGRTVADTEIVRSLFERAKGYSHEVTRNLLHQGVERTLTNTVRYPPDTQACMFWLRNRQRRYWGQKVDPSTEADDAMMAALDAASERARHAGD
jgi:transcriptional regulator with XRE-family HTH domain